MKNAKQNILEIIKDLNIRADELQAEADSKKYEKFFVNVSIMVSLLVLWITTFGTMKV
jgi:hypothetical protein